ncbi:MAG: undecaprenyl-diphosphatase UppP [Candidatus Nomurabacteria bacterium]|nr:MAG: undecaprenyl-diphosphatase UppP [Candidatus Nomurabacteria bacterium]
MFDALLSILFGLVQGVTEFFPISSSGHLVVLHAIWPDFSAADALAFDVALHVGTLCALLVFFRRDLWRIFLAGIRSITRRPDQSDSRERRMFWYLVVGSIPAALVGLFFESFLADTFRSAVSVGVTLFIGGLFFFWADRQEANRTGESIAFKDVIWIGLAQALALVPGISRSGSTIVAGRFLGLRHYDAARFSFLLSVPIVFAAAVKVLAELASQGVDSQEIFTMLLGFASSFITGLIAIRFLLRFFQSHTLRGFAWYRIALGILLIIFWL